MKKILVPLAEGFEEIEAITPIDVWRRVGYEVTVAGITESPITATRKTKHFADVLLSEVLDQDYDLIFLPGGRPGADHLAALVVLGKKIQSHFSSGKWIAAICAAPLVLDKLGLLDGKKFTCHPAARAELKNTALDGRVIVDGKIITAPAAGAAMELALAVINIFDGQAKVKEVNQGLLCPPLLLP